MKQQVLFVGKRKNAYFRRRTDHAGAKALDNQYNQMMHNGVGGIWNDKNTALQTHYYIYEEVIFDIVVVDEHFYSVCPSGSFS